MKFTIYQNSRQGPRQYNQDRLAYSYSKHSLLAVLADGMGGHRHGELAAQLAVKTLTDSFQRRALPILADPFKFLSEHIQQVHDAIFSHAAANDMFESPRTTIVAAVAQHDELYCAHVGDSRLYHFRDGRLGFRTEDHSKVQLMFRKGLISSREMLTHPERNKIYNCLGGDHPPRIDLAKKRALQEGDTIVLCSDGLWGGLDDEEMAEILQNGPVTDRLPVLFDLAESRLGRNGDNISAIAFNWGGNQAGGVAVSTATMPLDLTSTIINPWLSGEENEMDQRGGDLPVLTDEEIESAIAEIRSAIQKVSR